MHKKHQTKLTLKHRQHDLMLFLYVYVEMAMRMQLLSLVPLEGCYWSVKTYSFVH